VVEAHDSMELGAPGRLYTPTKNVNCEEAEPAVRPGRFSLAAPVLKYGWLLSLTKFSLIQLEESGWF